MSKTQSYKPSRATIMAGPGWPRCEELIRQYESALRQKTSPAIKDFLDVDPPERMTLLIELVHIDLEYRLKAGSPARVEDYLGAFPELAGYDEAVLDLLVEEYRLRRDRGEAMQIGEYEQRFPEQAERIRTRLVSEADTSTGEGPSRPGPKPLPVIPGYEILHEIGRGGMGIIYHARDPKLDRPVAIKFLPDEYARDSDHLRRFLHEARAASALNHPNICTVHALGEHEGRPYIVLEFIEGVTLRTWANRKPETDDIIPMVRQAVQALAAAHAAGVVHRDIKPDNIMLRPDGFVKVVDFGLARRAPGLTGFSVDTGPGVIFGTAAYMSPEQARGDTVDGASDIFSLGIVLYQLTTGRHPFEATTAAGVLHGITTIEPLAPSAVNPAVPRLLEDLISSMLRKERLLRPSAAEVLETLTQLVDTEAPPAIPPTPSPAVVHREVELGMLRTALQRADGGQGSVVCVSGEPGIGKTTLVEDFLTGIQVDLPACAILKGHCSERLAGTEAYLPILDALGSLCHADRAGTAARHVKVLAPTWHSQLTTQLEQTLPDVLTPPKALSRQAMLREFWNLLHELTRRGPVVLFIDDLHWADVSTVDLLSRVAEQCRTARLLVIVTYRQTEMLIGPHPFHHVKLELQAKGLCQELALGFLDRAQVCQYLTQVFPHHSFPGEFIDFIVSRTEGSPLFMADLLRYLRERGVLVERGGRWTLSGTLPDLRRDLPGSVRGMIERKLERLDKEDQRLLTAASVQGQEFDSAIVAEAVGLSADAAEERLRELERVHGLVRLVRDHELPDHVLSTRYTFVHVLYQQALYAEAAPSRRASLARALAASLQRHHEKDCPAVANELACLFEVGRDFRNAAFQFLLAARNAARMFAHREAAVLARHGLRLVTKLPPAPERDQLELELHTMLGLQLQVTQGFAAPGAKTVYTRARQLCPSPPTVDSYPVLWGLWLYAKVRSELDLAMDLAFELENLSRHTPDLLLQSQQALAVTTLCRGELTDTVRHMEKALSLYDPERHRTHSFQFGQDPAVACQAFGAVALALLGDHERARLQSRQALELSHRLMQPSSQVLALHFAAMLHQLCHEPEQTQVCAEMCGAIAAEHSFAFWSAGALVMRGWAAAVSWENEGMAWLRRGIQDWSATGSITYMPYYQGLLAEALLGWDEAAEARSVLDDAIRLAKETRESLYLPRLEAMLTRLTTEKMGE
jgi:hypothetical protein